jgi:hypothetical protein
MRSAVSQLDYIRTAVHAVPSSSTRRQRDEAADRTPRRPGDRRNHSGRRLLRKERR